MKALILSLAVLSAPLCLAQTTTPSATEQTTKELLSLLEGIDLNKIKFEASTTKEAAQQLCDEICKKLAVKDESKIVIKVNMPPVYGQKIQFTAKYLTARELLEKFCKDNNIHLSYENGMITFSPDFRSVKREELIKKLKAVKLPKTKITAEYLPDSLRKLLSPHGLSFTIHNSKGKNAKPISLNKMRISRFQKNDSNLFDVLAQLGASVKLDLWVTAQGLTFTQKNTDFSEIVRSSSLKK